MTGQGGVLSDSAGAAGASGAWAWRAGSSPRWRPENITGVPDGEIAAILWQLLLDRDQGRTR